MAQSAIDWEVAPDSSATYDPDNQWPAVFPIARAPVVRQVGVVKAYTPAKVYGLVEDLAGRCDAVFCIDDVAPGDRSKLGCGQTVTFEMVEGPDGRAAKQIRIDLTSLPPPPHAGLISKGWR